MEEQKTKFTCCLGNSEGRKFVPTILAMLLLAAVIIVAILREKIVSSNYNSITVMGRGTVEYQPNQAEIALGVQIDKAANANEALVRLNEKVIEVIKVIKEAGVDEKLIKTQNYSLTPQYDYVEGVSKSAGYNANQTVLVKVEGIDKDPDKVGKIISAAGAAGSDQVNGLSFNVAEVEKLKDKARLQAITEARKKLPAITKTLGMRKMDKVMGMYETIIQSPDNQNQPPIYYDATGMGGTESKGIPAPQITNAKQEIVIEVGISYQVK